VQSILSELKRLSRDAHASDKLDDKMTAGALDDIVKVMQDHIGEQNPNLADQLSQVNKSYARFTRLVDAASSTAAKEGVFSPTQLTQSVRRLERNKGKSAKGQAMMQDLAEAGKKVIAPSISDSGTVERGLTGAILGGLHLPTTALMTGAAIPALYSSWGQKAARAALTKRPAGAQAVSDILKRYAPLVGGGLGATGFGGSQ
jgi:hypothetical protein